MNTETTMTWIIRAVGTMATLWGLGMLIASRSAPDPLNPAAFVLSVVAGGLLLWIGYARNSRRHATEQRGHG